MNDFGKLIAPDTLYYERLLPGPASRVWKYLTDPELRGKWFASGPMALKENGKIEFHFNHQRLSDQPDPAPEKYIEHDQPSKSPATVTKVNPPFLLSFFWENSEVTITLTDQGDEVLLTLTHKNLDKDTDTRVGIMAGWHAHLNILRDLLNDRPCQGFWKEHMRLEKEYLDQLISADKG